MFGMNRPIIQKELWGYGPAPGEFYNFTGGVVNPINSAALKPYTAPGIFGTQHASQPITTGTSVVGIKFDGGVMIAADNLVSYGSLARYQKVERVYKINKQTILGAGGDFADFQNIKRTIDQKITQDTSYQDDIVTKPKSLYNWLTRIMYNRRSRMNPMWLELVIGGIDNDGVPFLGTVDFRGRAYEDTVIATGFGKHLALPLVREQLTEGESLTQEKASEVLRKCMEIMYYRDCRAMSKYTVAVCTKEGSVVQGPFEVHENWNVAAMVKGY